MELIQVEENNNVFSNGNSFTCCRLLEEMILYSSPFYVINMNHILNIVEKCTDPTEIHINLDKIYILNIYEITKQKFSFKFNNIHGIKLFRKPFIYWHNDGYKYEFISEQQFNSFLKKFNYPKIKCNEDGNCIKANILDLRYHIMTLNHKDVIIEGYTYNILDKNDFSEFFMKKNISYINKKFDSPENFEKNFQYYFDMNKKLNIKDSFYIYDDEAGSREYFSDHLLVFTNNNNIKYYYGSSGQGKSITLIGALKYRNNFNRFGSLYINCKALKCLLLKKKYIVVKQIFIDEILYLFPFNYTYYNDLIKLIMSFNFVDEFSYILLIKVIVEFLDKTGSIYLVAFDQYNDSNDPNFLIKGILRKYINKENLYFLIFSSMNETDVRNIKMNSIMGELEEEDYHEIRKICDIKVKDWKIDKKLAFNKLGKTFKAMIELQYTNNTEQYLELKEFKLTKKIIAFYLKSDDKITNYCNDKERKIIQIPNYIIGNIISFKTDFNYDKKSLNDIINNVPFRYFDIKNKGNNKYIIKFSFPFIEEIFKDIYKRIAFNYSYNTLKKILDNKGSGLGTLFEMKIIQHLFENPNSFKDIYITGHHIIQTIVPKDNEKKDPVLKLTLRENKTYLIEQKVFGGKTLDCLIIYMKMNIPILFGLQISILKEHIFEIIDLYKSYETMINNLQKIFSITIKIENTYFGYIFDYSRLGGKDYDNMLKKCKERKLKYCFFDPDNNTFISYSNREINSIYEFVSCPFINMKNDIIFKTNKIYYDVTNYFKIESSLNINDKKRIIDFLSSKTKNTIKELKFLYKSDNPKCKKNIINIKIMPKGIQFFYLEDKNLFHKLLDKDTNTIVDANIIEGVYDVYEIIFN